MGERHVVEASLVSRVRVDLILNIKDILDPHEIMNPGKLIEGRTRYGVPIPPIGMKIGMGALATVKRMTPRDKD